MSGFSRPSVSRSGSDISSPPSPTAHTVRRSGRATAAPSALPSARPTHWNAWGKTKPWASGTGRHIGGETLQATLSRPTARSAAAHPVPLGGKQRVEGDRQRARVQPVAAGLERLVAPAAGGDLVRE